MKRKIFIILLLSITLLTVTSCRKKLTVIFDYIYKTEEVTIKKGKKLEKPADPIREGYTFLEWQLDGETYDFSKKVKSNLTIVALYSDNNNPVIVLDTPQNVKYENSQIIWDNVNNATSYNVNIDGNIYNTTSTSYAYNTNLEEKGFTTITVVACSNKGFSKASKPIIVEYTYSISEMKEILNTNITSDMNKNLLKYYNSVCAGLTKYGFTLAELNKIRDFDDLISNNRLADYIGVYTFINNADTKYSYSKEDSVNKPELDDELQTLFENMKNSNVYSSNYTKAIDDEKFMYLVVGGLGYFSYLVPMKPANYPTVFDYLDKFFNINKYSSYKPLIYEIRKNEDEITFISQLDSKEYKLTKDEIMKIMEYYYNTKEKEYESLYLHTDEARKRIYNTEYQYGEYLYDLKVYTENTNKLEEIIETDIKLYNKIDQNKDKFNQIIKDIYNFSQNINDEIYTKFEKTLNKIINGDTSVETITQFKNQLIDLLSTFNNIIKSKEDVSLVFDIIENAKFLINDLNAQSLELLEVEVKILIEVINQFEKTISQLNVNDLQIALQLLNDPNNQEALSKLEEIAKTLENSLESIDTSDINTKLILDSLDTFFKDNFGENYKSLFSLEYGLQFNNQEIELLEEEIKEIIEYVSEYPHIDDLKNLIMGYINTNQLSNDYQVLYDFIEYLLDYVTSNKLDEYNFYVKNYIEFKYKDYDVDEDKYYIILHKNIDILKKFYFTEIKLDLETQGYENEEKLKKSLELVKQEFTNDEMKEYLFAKKQIENLLNNRNEKVTNNPYYNDFSSSIEKLISLIGKYNLELTDEDSKLIVEFRKIFNNIQWVYPTWVEVVIDQENKQVNIKFKDDLLEICPNIKMTDYGAFCLMIYEHHNEGIMLYFEERVSAQLQDTMISISFKEIAEELNEHKYIDSVYEFKKTYGNAHISIEFDGSLENIQYVIDGKYGYYTDLASLRTCNYLNDYLEEIFETLK